MPSPRKRIEKRTILKIISNLPFCKISCSERSIRSVSIGAKASTCSKCSCEAFFNRRNKSNICFRTLFRLISNWVAELSTLLSPTQLGNGLNARLQYLFQAQIPIPCPFLYLLSIEFPGPNSGCLSVKSRSYFEPSRPLSQYFIQYIVAFCKISNHPLPIALCPLLCVLY